MKRPAAVSVAGGLTGFVGGAVSGCVLGGSC